MPRKPRHYLPGLPAHVIQRGNNRQTCFRDDNDYQSYLDWLVDAAKKCDCLIHAYCLMTNHVHLLVTPACSSGISEMMQSIGRQYVRYFNTKYRRTGTLWEGRHKGHLVETGIYLLRCCCYIDLNPVRAGLVAGAEDYRWSSACVHVKGHSIPWLTDHELFRALGSNDGECNTEYKRLLEAGSSQETLDEIRTASRYAVPFGSKSFRQHVESRLGRSIGHTRRGRPRRAPT